MSSPAPHLPHPAAQIYRLMNDQELSVLEEMIRKVGRLTRPIVLLGNLILDGRNREHICLKIGIEPTYVQYDGPTDIQSLLDYVKSENEAHRHLTPEDRQFAAEQAANLLVGRPKGEEIVSHETISVPRGKAAEMFGVSTMGVNRARTVINKGVPELEAAVRAGKVTISAAAEVAAGHDHDKQRELLAAGPRAVTAAAVERRKKRETPQPRHWCGENHVGDCPNVVPVAKPTKRGQAILTLAEELFELARRPQHRYPYLQIAQKTEELRGACRRAFGPTA